MKPDDLTTGERLLWRAAQAGEMCIFDKEIITGGSKSSARIRGELLQELCTNSDYQFHFRGVRLRGAEIVGPVDLTSADILRPLELYDCSLEAPLLLDSARGKTVTLSNCSLPGLSAQGLTLTGNLALSQCFTSGEISVRSATLVGYFLLHSCELQVDDRTMAFNGELLRADGGIRIERCNSEGTLMLGDASTRGGLTIVDTTIQGSPISLECHRLEVAADLVLDNVRTAGRVNLQNARVTGSVRIINSVLDDPHRIAAVSATRTVIGETFIIDSTNCRGSVELIRCEVAEICAVDTNISDSNHRGTFIADFANVTGAIYLSSGFHANSVSLLGASASEVRIVRAEVRTIDARRLTALDGIAAAADSPSYAILVTKRKWRKLKGGRRIDPRTITRTQADQSVVLIAVILTLALLITVVAMMSSDAKVTVINGTASILEILAWSNLTLTAILASFIILLPTRTKEFVTGRAATLGRWALRNDRRGKDFAALVAEQVTSQLSGPELDNYIGYLSAALETVSEGQTTDPSLSSNAHEESPSGSAVLTVMLSPKEEALDQRLLIELRGGRDVTEAEFEIRPTIGGRPADPSSATVTVPTADGTASASFNLPGWDQDDIFVELLQQGEIIDVLRVINGGSDDDEP